MVVLVEIEVAAVSAVLEEELMVVKILVREHLGIPEIETEAMEVGI